MTGHITDGVGFILNLKEHGVEGQKMVIIGTVFIEDLDNKEKFAEVVSESNILVNATRKRKIIVITLRQAVVTTACLNYEKILFLYNYLIHKHH